MKELSTDAIVAEIQRLWAQLAVRPDPDPMSPANQRSSDHWQELDRRVQPQLHQVLGTVKKQQQQQELREAHSTVLQEAVATFHPGPDVERTYAFHGFYRNRLIWKRDDIARRGRGRVNWPQDEDVAAGIGEAPDRLAMAEELATYRTKKRSCLDRLVLEPTFDAAYSFVLVMQRCRATKKLESLPLDVVMQLAVAERYSHCVAWMETWNADDEVRSFVELQLDPDEPTEKVINITLSMLYTVLSPRIDEGHVVSYEDVAFATNRAAKSDRPVIKANAIRQRIARARPILDENLRPSEFPLFF